MRTLVWVLASLAFVLPFAVPGFLPSDDAYQRAIALGFTPEQIAVGKQYTFERRVLSWCAIALNVVILAALVANARALTDWCGRRVGGRWLPTLLLVGLVIAVAEAAVNLPFGLVRLEHMRAWGLTQQSPVDWLQQHLLALVVFTPLEGIVLVSFFLLIYLFPRTWWVWSAFGATLVAIAGAFLLPIVFAPLFNTFRPLHETEWRELEPMVQALLAKAHVQVQDVLVMDASRQSGHTNAYFTGFGPTRRIVSSTVGSEAWNSRDLKSRPH